MLSLFSLCEGLEREYRFHPARKWRLDFAWPARRVGVEIDGFGLRNQYGGHQTRAGRINDCAKDRAAVLLGWRILRYTTADIGTMEDLASAAEDLYKLLGLGEPQ
jgi:very-short-patch-repair endonuclease